MDNLQDAQSAIRRQESRGNYRYQQRVRANGTTDRKVGAYGMLESRFIDLAASMGYSGARWYDPAIQDRVAAEKLKRDYDKLGSWELAVVAFRFGTPVAEHFREQGLTEPADFELAGYKNEGQYIRNVRKNDTSMRMPVEGRVGEKQPDPTKKLQAPTKKRSEAILRSHMMKLRDRQRGAMPPAEPEDESMSAEADTVEVPE